MAFRRLQHEIKDYVKSLPTGILKLSPKDNLMEWSTQITGPEGSPYEDGIFKMNIYIPDSYPFRPPKIRFATQVFHPNINKRGEICLDLLKDKWSAALCLSTIVMAIQSLLDQPNPNDPLEPEIAELMRSSPEEFERIAREWTEKYASDS